MGDGKRASKWDTPPVAPQQSVPSSIPSSQPALQFGAGAIDGMITAEVRYDDPMHAQQAIEKLNGSILGGVPIGVRMHGMKNPQLTKLLVTGLPKHTHWIMLKNHFNTIGTVAFANVLDGSEKGKGGCGKGFGGGNLPPGS